MSTDTCIRILSLNCWGLKYVAKNRDIRMHAIATQISKSDYDIVGLQELWVHSDFELIRGWVANRLPCAKFFYSGALGAGLAIFSRFPIITATNHPYSLNGAPIDVKAGDWFVGKAAACAVIMHPLLGEVDVYNTHLFAKGGEDGPEHNRAHRLVNAWEFSKLVRTSASSGRYVIALGDFNSIPSTLPIRVIREHTGLIDAWTESHGNIDVDSSMIDNSPEIAITRFGVTADSPLNSYSAGKPLDPTARKYQGKRLDYIFYRHPLLLDESKPRLSCSDTKVSFTERIPGTQISFSDHFGLEATIEVVLPKISHHPTTAVVSVPLPDIADESIQSIVQALMACYRISAHTSRVELCTFVVGIIILFVLTVTSAWLPRSWINPVVILFTIFISWLSTTMLYSGFLYGNWERRALTNVIEELELMKASRQSRSP